MSSRTFLPDTLFPPGMPGMPGMVPPGGAPSRGPSGRGQPGMDQEEDTVSGFAVIIEGFTPHEDNLAFLFPTDVELQRDRWGFFNRLRYLGKSDEDIIAEEKGQTSETSSGATRPTASAFGARTAVRGPNEPAPRRLARVKKENVEEAEDFLPFETYVAPDELRSLYFDVSEGGWVSGTAATRHDQPTGLGIISPQGTDSTDRVVVGTRTGRSQSLTVYVDPLTFEPISQTYVRNADGEIVYDSAGKPKLENHDYWFRVKFKVRVKENVAGFYEG